jgi:hypothetical protein
MHTLFPHSSAELRKVGKIQFGVLSPDEIVRLARIIGTPWFKFHFRSVSVHHLTHLI